MDTNKNKKRICLLILFVITVIGWNLFVATDLIFAAELPFVPVGEVSSEVEKTQLQTNGEKKRTETGDISNMTEKGSIEDNKTINDEKGSDKKESVDSADERMESEKAKLTDTPIHYEEVGHSSEIGEKTETAKKQESSFPVISPDGNKIISTEIKEEKSTDTMKVKNSEYDMNTGWKPKEGLTDASELEDATEVSVQLEIKESVEAESKGKNMKCVESEKKVNNEIQKKDSYRRPVGIAIIIICCAAGIAGVIGWRKMKT